MYIDYFGLAEKPFSIAPDPRYLFMSEQHQEALGHLLYGVRTEGGFVLLTGEVGTGKTTVCRCLLEQMPDECQVAFVLNPRLTDLELMASICDEFGISYEVDSLSIKQLTDRLVNFLLQAHSAGRSPVLIIDEAQNLAPEVLEQIRLLTNLETSRKKLLQVILLGQPELRQLLARQELRQLAQRITARFHLGSLSPSEVGNYLRYRLATAGCDRLLFPPPVVALLARISGGVPRLINLICDRALLGCYAEGRQQVDRGILRQAAREVLGEEQVRVRHPLAAFRSLAAGLMVLVVLTGVLIYRQFPHLPSREETPAVTVSERGDGPQTAAERGGGAAEPAVPSSVGEGKAPETLIPVPEPALEANPTAAPAQKPQSVTTQTAVDTSVDQDVPDIPLNDWLLQQVTPGRDEPALATLLGTWGLTGFAGDACEIAVAKGLRCLESAGSLSVLRSLDRPVLLRLLGGQGNLFSVTLLQMTEHEALLGVGREELRLPLRDLQAAWMGDYLLLWQAPVGYVRALAPGATGDVVDWLAQRLKQLGFLAGAVPESGSPLGGPLLEALQRFQGSQGLRADGVLGPHTLIHLNSRSQPGGPRLQEQDS